MESKSIGKSEVNTHRHLVTYQMRALPGKFHAEQKISQIINGDLEQWFIQLCFDNPEYNIIVEVACPIW